MVAPNAWIRKHGTAISFLTASRNPSLFHMSIPLTHLNNFAVGNTFHWNLGLTGSQAAANVLKGCIRLKALRFSAVCGLSKA